MVVKEPGSHVADQLLSLFPGSRLVFLLRDGRDVVDSWLAAYRAGSWALDEGAFPVTDAGRESLVRWQSAVWAFRTEVVRRAYDAHPPDRRVMIRYEDLVADPCAELARLCAALPVDAPADRLAAVAGEHAYEAVPAGRQGRAQGDPLGLAGRVARQPDPGRARRDARGHGRAAGRARLPRPRARTHRLTP